VLYQTKRPAQISEPGFPPETSVRAVVTALPQAAGSAGKEPSGISSCWEWWPVV